MRILLTNDDGIQGEGLRVLKKALQKKAQVDVVAPEAEKSASGHSLTVLDPLRVTPVRIKGRFFGFSVNGTPADCVKLSVKALLRHKPDLVVSGINPGHNTGTNVLYSGTVSAAIEGNIMGVPAMAVSIWNKTKKPAHYGTAGVIAGRIIEKIKKYGLPSNILLNVNVPDKPLSRIQGIRVTRQGKFKYTDTYLKRRDPKGGVYYWLTAEQLSLQEPEGSDMNALQKGFVSITPLHYDLTDHGFMEKLQAWRF